MVPRAATADKLTEIDPVMSKVTGDVPYAAEPLWGIASLSQMQGADVSDWSSCSVRRTAPVRSRPGRCGCAPLGDRAHRSPRRGYIISTDISAVQHDRRPRLPSWPPYSISVIWPQVWTLVSPGTAARPRELSPTSSCRALQKYPQLLLVEFRPAHRLPGLRCVFSRRSSPTPSSGQAPSARSGPPCCSPSPTCVSARIFYFECCCAPRPEHARHRGRRKPSAAWPQGAVVPQAPPRQPSPNRKGVHVGIGDRPGRWGALRAPPCLAAAAAGVSQSMTCGAVLRNGGGGAADRPPPRRALRRADRSADGGG